MIPRLFFCFGGAPHPSNDWLQVPQWKLWTYIRMLPTLEAQRELRDYRVGIAAGGLQMDEHAHARYLGGLQRRAEGITERPKLSPQEIREQLAASPLKVVTEGGG